MEHLEAVFIDVEVLPLYPFLLSLLPIVTSIGDVRTRESSLII